MREDDRVPQSASTRAVCRRSRSQGTFSDAGDVFICVQCQEDANHFLRIQDDIWPTTDESDGSTNETDRPPPP